MFDVFHLFLIGLQCRLQGVSELSQLLPLSILSLFDLQRKRNSDCCVCMERSVSEL